MADEDTPMFDAVMVDLEFDPTDLDMDYFTFDRFMQRHNRGRRGLPQEG